MKPQTEKKNGHIFADCGGTPRCTICGADEDDAFVGGEECKCRACGEPLTNDGCTDKECELYDKDAQERCPLCGSGLANDDGDCQKCGV
jgi:hypothetical protein